jgi:hypothetical protein
MTVSRHVLIETRIQNARKQNTESDPATFPTQAQHLTLTYNDKKAKG